MVKTKRKACKKCKAIVDPNINICPVCGSKEFTEDFAGIVAILNLDSEIAKRLNIKKEWVYALKVR